LLKEKRLNDGLVGNGSLSKEEQIRLYKKAKDGDKNAELRLFKSLEMLIVTKLLIPYNISSSYWDDALNSCYFGFKKALEQFDPSRSVKFSTYAFDKLRASVQQWMFQNAHIRVPQKKIRVLSKLEQYLNEIEQDASWPWQVSHKAIEEFCRAIGIDQKIIESLIRWLRLFKVENIGEEGENSELAELVFWNHNEAHIWPVEEEVLKILRQEALQEALELALTEREKSVIELRFGINGHRPHTLEETASEIGPVSKEAVRMIQKRSLKKLRAFFLDRHPEFCYAV